MKKPDPYKAIYELLSRGVYYAPHEVQLQLRLLGCHVSPEATTARMRDLRKPQYGQHKLVKRTRPGTGYFEYTIPTSSQQEA